MSANRRLAAFVRPYTPRVYLGPNPSLITSGSLVCFGIASYSWPGCIGVWGKWEDEIDPDTLLLLNSPGRGIADEGLGALMKVIRSSDVAGIARDFIAHDLVWY